MRTVSLKQFAKLREDLFEEKAQLESRLTEINAVLGAEAPRPAASVTAPARPARPVRRRGRGRNMLTLREAVTQALGNGPLGRKELAEAVQSTGYVSRAKDPIGSMGAFLYSKNSPFKHKDGKFYLPGGSAPAASATPAAAPAPGKKRFVSKETRAKLSAAQSARWARNKKAA